MHSKLSAFELHKYVML